MNKREQGVYNRRLKKVRVHLKNVFRGLVRRGADRLDAAVAAWTTYFPKTLEFICVYCVKMTPLELLSVDHAQPLSRGGTNSIRNLTRCCKRCNLLKGSLTKDEYLAFRAFVCGLEDDARRDVERRMLAGGRVFHG